MRSTSRSLALAIGLAITVLPMQALAPPAFAVDTARRRCARPQRRAQEDRGQGLARRHRRSQCDDRQGHPARGPLQPDGLQPAQKRRPQDRQHASIARRSISIPTTKARSSIRASSMSRAATSARRARTPPACRSSAPVAARSWPTSRRPSARRRPRPKRNRCGLRRAQGAMGSARTSPRTELPSRTASAVSRSSSVSVCSEASPAAISS